MPDSKKNILSHSKMTLTAPKLPNGSYPPKFKVQTYNNNVQFAIFTGLDNSGVINAGMDPITFYTALAMIERMIKEPTPAKDEVITYKVENDQGRGKDKALKSTTVIGKDSEGVLFISVLSTDSSMPKVKFNFNTDFYHRISIPGVSKATVSELAAQAWVDALRVIMGVHLTTTYEPVVFNGGGNNYRSNNNNNNGGGGFNHSESPTTDGDIPW